jgi:high-affinity K+ transport system ATPase subunit B
MTRFAVTAFLVAKGVAKCFAIARAVFAARRLGWRSAA